ncbi:Alpha/beta hydrolase family protein [Microbacterium sp. cf046]|uniref:alpha/beta fold hydrolase n=1 Tax=Microbacterium sp. cf046 TaxID=1761803 RepID=UPI0008E7D5E8|nr:alpha/beta hydrolase [Microbacterium sp. cf046]SFS08488.1 Alpha/beta hydrolase family protein [Microbacterium sp. cf046]
MTDTQIFDVDGRAIPYAIDGAGPALVLIPGQGRTIDYLAALAHSIAEADFRVVRIGPRGSDPDVSLQDIAQDVIDVMDHLGVDHAWVGGHGFGGSVARIASVDHHDRVNGVLLLGVEGPAEGTGELPPLAQGVPVLVIQGTDDEVTPPSNGDDLQASAPDRVSAVRIEGGTHMFPATHVGATSWAIEDYLDWD